MNMFMNYYREYIALTGGSSAGNYMHLQKTIGVLKALAEKEGLTYSEDVEKLAYTVEDVQKRYKITDAELPVLERYLESRLKKQGNLWYYRDLTHYAKLSWNVPEREEEA